MRDFVYIGSSPVEEDCVQVGSENYSERSRIECNKFIELIRKVCGEEPERARLVTKSFPHDFGSYREVVCYFDDEYPDSVDYAFFVEGNTPETWNDKKNSKMWVPSISKEEKFQVIQEFYGFEADEMFLERELEWLSDLRHPVRKWLDKIYDLYRKEE